MSSSTKVDTLRFLKGVFLYKRNKYKIKSRWRKEWSEPFCIFKEIVSGKASDIKIMAETALAYMSSLDFYYC